MVKDQHKEGGVETIKKHKKMKTEEYIKQNLKGIQKERQGHYVGVREHKS